MVKHTQSIRRLLPTNCLSVFDHDVELAVKRLNMVFTSCLLKPALATLMCLNNPMFQVSCPSCQYLCPKMLPYFAYLYNTNTKTPPRIPH